MNHYYCASIFIIVLLAGSSSINAKPQSIINSGNVVIDDGNNLVIAGDLTIENGVINCAGIICPANSFQCTVTKVSTPPKNAVIVISKNCTSENGTLLVSNVTTSENQYPGSPVSSYSLVNKNGDATSCGYCSPLPTINSNGNTNTVYVSNPNVTKAIATAWEHAVKRITPEVKKALNSYENEITTYENAIKKAEQESTLAQLLGW